MKAPTNTPVRGEPRPPLAAPAAAEGGRPFAIGVGIAFAVFAVYGATLRVPFVFDDLPSILRNPTITHLWPLWRPLSPPHGSGLTVEGRPLLNLSLAVNHAISGTAPWSYHALNVLIHAAVALLLFGLLRRTLRAAGFAAPAAADALGGTIALVWAVHPLQTEAVTYVIQRAESLAAFFYLLTLYGFARYVEGGDARALAAGDARPRRAAGHGWAAWSVLACGCGMATKEIMYSAPLVVLLYDRAFASGSFAAAWRRRRLYYIALAATWGLLAVLVLGTGNRGGTAGFGIGVTPWQYAKTQFQAIAHYVWLCLWPHPLIFDYGVQWAHSAADVIPYAIVVGALLVTTGYAVVRRPRLALPGVIFFAILAPTSSFLPGNRQTLAEHRMYLPSAAVITLVVLAAYRWGKVLGRPRTAAVASRASRVSWGLAAAALTVAAACAALTVRRNEDYRTQLALFRDTVAKRPGNAFAHYNFGELLDQAGEPEAAIREYREAIRLDPTRSAPFNNLGKTLADLGRLPEAIAAYRGALRLNPGYARAHHNLGDALLRVGRKAEARAEFARAVQLAPDDLDARDNLAGLLLEAGRVPEAIRQLQAVLRRNADVFDAHYMLANAFMLQNQPGAAVREYEQALRLNPNFEDARRNLEAARRAAGE